MKVSQLALDLALAPDYSEAAFCITDANRVAYKAVQRWPQWRMGHLLLLGPPGSGKTHLARIWSARAGAVSLAPAKLGAELSQVQRGAAVLLEDAHEGVDQDGLFHLLNRAAGDAGVTHVMTQPWIFHGGPNATLAQKCDGLRRFADDVLRKLEP